MPEGKPGVDVGYSTGWKRPTLEIEIERRI